MRDQVVAVAEGSGDLLAMLAKREVDAAIGWESMALLAPEKVEAVPIRTEWCTWRSTSVGVTPWSTKRELAEAFIKFLRSPEGIKIWEKFGWRPLWDARVETE